MTSSRPGRRSGRQSGQVLPLVALMIVALVGFTGLAVDAAIAYGHQRDHHNVADAAALAGAKSLSETWDQPGSVRQSQAIAAMTAVASQNGITLDPGAVYFTDFDGVRLPGAPPDYTKAQGVEVTVTQPYPTAFMRALGPQTTLVAASAKAVYGYPTEVNNILPIQIADDANIGVVGNSSCMSPASGGVCSTNFTPFQPPAPCSQFDTDNTLTPPTGFDPCFADVVQHGLPIGSKVGLTKNYPSRATDIWPSAVPAGCGPPPKPACDAQATTKPHGWGDSMSMGRLAYEYLLDRFKADKFGTFEIHQNDSSRVFFATVGKAESGNQLINVQRFQCVWLGKNPKTAPASYPDAPQADSFTVTYLKSCKTTLVPGGGLSKDPPSGAGDSARSAVVIHLIA